MKGQPLLIRSLIAGLIYAALWGLFAYLHFKFFGTDAVEIVNLFFLAGPILLIGASTAYFTFDFDFMTSFFHYGLYLLVTILLRLAMGLPAV